MKNRSDDVIADALSALGAWYPRHDRKILADYNELCKSLDKWMADFNNSLTDVQENPLIDKYAGRRIPYNASPFHFILYYVPPPNHPFVVFGADSIMFGFFGGKRNDSLSVSFPIYLDVEAAMVALDRFLNTPEIASLMQSRDIKNLMLRDIDEQFANVLRNSKYKKSFRLSALKEINYCIYDIQSTLVLHGKIFSNLRWRLNKFNKAEHRVKHVPLSEAGDQIIHLIGQWRRQALKERGFSYVDVRSDRFGAEFFKKAVRESGWQSEAENLKTEKVISRVLKVDGNIASFNLGYPLGLGGESRVFAHAIGISDISIPGLSEYAQMDFWKQVQTKGYRFINDGPTWRKGLAVYKDKFRPVARERYYWATVAVVK